MQNRYLTFGQYDSRGWIWQDDGRGKTGIIQEKPMQNRCPMFRQTDVEVQGKVSSTWWQYDIQPFGKLVQGVRIRS